MRRIYGLQRGAKMKTYSRLFRPLILILLAALIVFFAMGAFASRTLLVTGGALLVACVVFTIGYSIYINYRLRSFSLNVSSILSTAQSEALINFPMPVIVTLDNGEILWCNKLCQKTIFTDAEVYGRNISEVFGGMSFHGETQADIPLTYKDKKYSGFIARAEHGETAVNVLYLVDDTDLKFYKERYLQKRATIMLIMIDNYEEILQNAREHDRSQVLPAIEYAIEDYMKQYHAVLCRIERDKFLAVVEENYMQEIISSRFSLLDEVRKIEIADRVPATLSIGAGLHAGSLEDGENMAQQALDMSLGRGGDQAAIKTQNGYEFYGGVSKGIEKRTKVKTRIVANALAELIQSSSDVIVMGHRFADLDCVGSAVGMCRAVQLLGKPACVAINQERNLAKPLVAKLAADGLGELFRDPDELLEKVTKETLLIVVDVHSKHFLESGELYRKCKSVVVIDHHRKMVDYIDNAVIFYHEPYASSASEMVTELVQYFDMNKKLGRSEAEALLSGIMLDTKNFVMKAGVRTFEAAAYLKRLGADTVEVRKLFSSPMEDYQRKARLVSSATVYRRCAIAMSVGFVEDIKLVAPQAADELLSISDVDASFVIFENGSTVEISARSMGALNVQVVMEALGGGGHLNMAACQLPEVDIEDAHQRLLAAIDDYFDNLNQK